MQAMKRIEGITIKSKIDQDPDTSYLGQYSDKPGPGAIDRQARGDMGRNEFRYFNPSINDGYEEQAYKRMEAFDRGEWHYIGIVAVASVAVSLDGGNTWKSDSLTSGGIWGIESDSSNAYMLEVAQEEVNELKELLGAYGFTPEEIDAAEFVNPFECPH